MRFSKYLCLALLIGCGGSDPITDCNDGIDNDGDGLVDLDDPACPITGDAEFPDPSQCTNGLDDDGDGLTDFPADFGCEDAADEDEEDPTRQCNDMVDNDGDTLTDHPADPGCETPVDEDEFNPALCGNGVDDDGDARIDYPFDPGCESEDDTTETDPVPAPACADGMDNDGDMLVDFGADPGCNSAADNDEFNTGGETCGPGVSIIDISLTGMATGSLTTALPNNLTSPVCNGFGGEHVYTFQVMNPDAALYITTDFPDTTLDTVVYVRSVCQNPTTELDCNDDAPDGVSPGGSTLVIEEIEMGTYFIVVDAFGPGSLGDFQITVEERAGLGAPCDASDPAACVPGLICQPRLPGDPDTCEYPRCDDDLDNDGDAITDFPFEPGCVSVTDNDEADPAGGPPDCGNGIDDDADGLIDYPADPGCDFAADDIEIDECYPGKPVSPLDPVAGATGTTVGDTGVANGSCGGTDSGEDIFAISTDVPLVSMTISTDNATTTYDSVLYVRSGDCATGPEVACNNDISFTDTQSSVTFAPITGTDYFVFVDGGWMAAGAYELDVSGIIAAGGVCDPAITTFVCESGYACRESTPGALDWTCLVSRCNDDVDNDSDGFIDYPNDPGCATLSDDAEDFPNPITACSNGVDDDGDGFIDYPADFGCEAASDNIEIDECYPGKPVTMLDPATGASGSTVTDSGVTGGSCGGVDSPEDVYVISTDVPLVSLTITTDNPATTWDTLLYVRSGDCDTGTEVACNNDLSFSDQQSTVTFAPTLGTDYFVFVDGGWMASGSYELDVSGIIAAGGACDPAIPTFVCVSGYACRESTPGAADWSCLAAFCNDAVDNDGDGFTDYPADPGCASPSDDAEDFPNPVTACSNGVDDDGDGLIDWSGGDPGCMAASDNGELDECVPGAPVIDHPGGTVSGTTVGGSAVITAPCDPVASTTDLERVYSFNNTRTDVTTLHFDTFGSSIETILDVRLNNCAVAGPPGWCNDNAAGAVGGTSEVEIASPAAGNYYAVVHSQWSGSGAFNITIYGELPPLAPCTPGAADFVCATGATCSAVTNTCVPSACNDDVDNDGDGDIDFADPGCADISDNDETDPPGPAAQCSDGVDNDADALVDYPADPGCDMASDNVEQDCAHDLCVTGVALVASCDPCVASICAVDSYCCMFSWDSICVGEVTSVCGDTCP